MNLWELGVVDAAELLSKREVSSEELTKAVIGRVRDCDGKTGAYLTFDEEGALAAARDADARRAAGEDGPLLGVPVAIKDLINVKGQPCTCASKILKGYVSPYDATVTERLKTAGAVCAGRTNMDEFAMGSSCENSALGETRNPWNLEFVPGGSSGGSAAAVGGDLAIAALGTDTGGSIRQPAAFCGCVGVKPSYGRVSRFGVTAFASSLDQVGPMTKTVRDSARLLGALCGADGRDGTMPPEPVPDFEAATSNPSPKGLKIGVPREYIMEGTSPEIVESVKKAADEMARAGAEVEEVSLPHTDYAMAVYYVIAPAEASANLSRFDGVRYGYRSPRSEDVFTLYTRTRAEGFGQEVKRRIIMGTYVLSSGHYDAYYGRAQKVRTLVRRDFEKAFAKVDALLAPVTPSPAFKLKAVLEPLQMHLSDIFTVPASVAGVCAMSVPCGLSAGGLPLGVQFISAAFAEEKMFRAAAAYEALRGPMPKPRL